MPGPSPKPLNAIASPGSPEVAKDASSPFGRFVKHSFFVFVAWFIALLVATVIVMIPAFWLIGDSHDADLQIHIIVGMMFFALVLSAGASLLNIFGASVLLSTILLAAFPILFVLGGMRQGGDSWHSFGVFALFVLANLAMTFSVSFSFAHVRRKLTSYFIPG